MTHVTDIKDLRDTIASLNTEFRHHGATSVLEAALSRPEFGKIAMVSSFGAESVALLHLVAMVDRTTPVLFIDTQMLFAETLVYQTEVAERLGLKNVRAIHADPAELARRDPLTGLANRRALLECFERFAARSTAVRLMVVDIDRFKTINDRFGHDVGDAVLQAIAHLLRTHARGEICAARLGGEEFAVYLLGAGATGAVNAAERIRAALEDNKTYYEGNIIRVTASLGGALFPQKASYSTIFQGADFALYRAKRSGRNQCEFNGLPSIWQSQKNPEAVDDSDAA